MKFWTIIIAGQLIASTTGHNVATQSQTERSEENEMAVKSNRALLLRTREKGDMAEIEVIANSSDVMNVTYKLNVFGRNTTRHSGSTKVYPDAEMLLSRVRVAAEEHWCAKLEVKQDNGLSYQLESDGC